MILGKLPLTRVLIHASPIVLSAISMHLALLPLIIIYFILKAALGKTSIGRQDVVSSLNSQLTLLSAVLLLAFVAPFLITLPFVVIFWIYGVVNLVIVAKAMNNNDKVEYFWVIEFLK